MVPPNDQMVKPFAWTSSDVDHLGVQMLKGPSEAKLVASSLHKLAVRIP